MKDDGGAAFPDPGRAQSEKQRAKLGNPGMSLRDWFAGQTLQGMMMTADPWGAAESGSVHWIVTAKIAYACADAMIAEREKS